MKKIIVIFLLVFGLVGSFSIVKAESKLPSWEFLPNGVNYIDPSNVWYKPTNGGNSGSIRTISKFRVLPDTEYRIYKIHHDDIDFGDADITQYDEYGAYVFMEEDEYTEVSYDDLYISFYTEPSTYFISFIIEVQNIGGNDVQIWNIEDNYYMIESSILEVEDDEPIPEYDYEYQGPDLGENIRLGDTIYMETNASDPIPFSTINNSLIVYDFRDTEITNKKQIISNTYGTSNYSVGEFEIKYSVTNSLNLTTYLTINIKVNDDIPPVLSGNTEYTMYNVDLKTLNDVKATLSAIDNVDGDISNNIMVDSTHDSFTNRETKLGTYPVTFYVVDSKGNRSEMTINVNVVQGDFTGPVFSGSFEQVISTSNPKTIDEILGDIKAIDDYSGDVTDRIEVIYNEYMYNTNKKGLYKITLRVVDDEGNITTKDMKITVIEDSSPIFVLKPINVYLPLKANMETVDDVITLLQKTGYLSNDMVTITKDGYSENKYALGSYMITLEQDNLEYNVLVNVTEQTTYLANIELPKEIDKQEVEVVKKNPLNVMYNICSRIKAFFKDFFSSLF